jgi:hypothetical protein
MMVFHQLPMVYESPMNRNDWMYVGVFDLEEWIFFLKKTAYNQLAMQRCLGYLNTCAAPPSGTVALRHALSQLCALRRQIEPALVVKVKENVINQSSTLTQQKQQQ